jgi:hypothetical protein
MKEKQEKKLGETFRNMRVGKSIVNYFIND